MDLCIFIGQVKVMMELLSYFIQFAGERVVSIFWILFFYVFAKYIFCVVSSIFYKRDAVKDFKFFKSIVLFYIIIFAFFLLLGSALGTLETNVSATRISFFNDYFIQMDKNIFGKYISFWMQDMHNPAKPFLDFLSPVIINTYRVIDILIGSIFLLFFFKNGKSLYKLAVSFALTLVISIPLWATFPALSPFDAYYINTMNVEAPKGVQTAMSTYRPNENLASVFDAVGKLDKKYTNFYAITTMPSMHIGWSVLIVYFGIVFWPPLAIFLIPYFLVNAVSTLYILQHYAIDLPAGFAVGVISIWLAHKISERGVPRLIMELTTNVQEDFRGATGFLWGFWYNRIMRQ